MGRFKKPAANLLLCQYPANVFKQLQHFSRLPLSNEEILASAAVIVALQTKRHIYFIIFNVNYSVQLTGSI